MNPYYYPHIISFAGHQQLVPSSTPSIQTTQTPNTQTTQAANQAPESLEKKLGLPDDYVQADVLKSFISNLVYFIQMMSNSFPKCEKLKEMKEKINSKLASIKFAQIEIINKWHSEMKPHITAIHEGKFDEILALPDEKLPKILTEVNFRKKWKALKSTDGDKSKGIPSSREKVVNLIVHLNSLSSIYVSMPEKMRKTMESVALAVSKEVDLNKGPTQQQILQAGYEVMDNIQQEEFGNFLDHVTGLCDDLGGMSTVQQFVGEEKIAKDIKNVLIKIKDNPTMKQMLINEHSKRTKTETPNFFPQKGSNEEGFKSKKLF